MSLFRQLWLAVILVTLTSFIGSFAVSMQSTRSYLEQQLHRKNIDSANSLALSISQLSKDPITIGLQITALFDSGQYETISIISPDGKVVAERVQNRVSDAAPEWFIDLFPIHAEAGRAQISDNWMQFGVVKVVSHPHLAQQALWEQTETLIVWFLIAGALSGLIGMLILHSIKRPLAAMVGQAEAITERRFLTISEPRIPELRSIARAINDLVRRLHNRFIEETSQLEALHKQIHHDPVTGLANRDYFMNHLPDALNTGETASGDIQSGILLIIRLNDLAEINRKLGHTGTNNLLCQIGTLMANVASEAPDRLAARLNGSDFVLVIPNIDDAGKFANQLTMELTALLPQADSETADFCHIGAIHYQHGDKPDEILASADNALATAERKGINAWHVIAGQASNSLLSSANISDWRHIFSDALNEDRFKLMLQPVVDPAGAQLHQEAVIRLQAQRDGDWLAASDFIAIAARLNLTGPVDLNAIRHALRSQAGEIAVGLSIETITDWGFRNQLAHLLRQYPQLCRRLWLEVPEYGAFREFEAFRDFCHTFKELGCRIGIEHFGHHFGEFQKLTDLGLDYLKIDASFVRGINQKKNNQKFLKGLCSLAHSIGIIVIAVAVQSEAEQKALIKLGFDGLTGPGVK
ncbi:EAL domain-containing protein [Nitrosospira sp. NpAV]|uniref:bifunctional diguanylate cyclase/phosphodiesterase n=1 Tax=Nitrosospira sp. NpAV TaxID=58133 RepID=UPI0005A1E0FF|nr:EAL domain-containing protein [Nitrosospira sp. NpAV]KIO48907.1 diguanylate cyclase [Nitrosospira sp. NpAV]